MHACCDEWCAGHTLIRRAHSMLRFPAEWAVDVNARYSQAPRSGHWRPVRPAQPGPRSPVRQPSKVAPWPCHALFSFSRAAGDSPGQTCQRRPVGSDGDRGDGDPAGAGTVLGGIRDTTRLRSVVSFVAVANTVPPSGSTTAFTSDGAVAHTCAGQSWSRSVRRPGQGPALPGRLTEHSAAPRRRRSASSRASGSHRRVRRTAGASDLGRGARKAPGSPRPTPAYS